MCFRPARDAKRLAARALLILCAFVTPLTLQAQQDIEAEGLGIVIRPYFIDKMLAKVTALLASDPKKDFGWCFQDVGHQVHAEGSVDQSSWHQTGPQELTILVPFRQLKIRDTIFSDCSYSKAVEWIEFKEPVVGTLKAVWNLAELTTRLKLE